jgi:ubiquinone/menaquinone biosynthesis C-methylase UbiE
MSKSRRSAVQKYHDRVAPQYDHSYEDVFWQWHDSLTWDYLKPVLPVDLSSPAVDLGCGTGKWAARLVKTGYDVTCVDVSARMLDQARRKIEQPGGPSRAKFIQADLCDLSALPASCFSLAVALGEPIGCAASPAKAMKQIRRILTDRGSLVASFDNRLAAIEFYLQAKDPKALAKFLRDGRTHWLTRDADEQFPIFTFGPSDIRKLAEATGFEVLDMVGKTVLPMRTCRKLLESSEARRAWARIEKKLCRDLAAIGRAPHLQVVFRKTEPHG